MPDPSKTDVKDTAYTVSPKFDPSYSKSLAENLMAPIDQRYFQCRFIGFDTPAERNNQDRPLIYISNHSGMAFPWDGIVFSTMLFRRYNYQLHHAVRPLAAPELSRINLLNPFLIKDFWKISGGVEAKYIKFERMMNQTTSNILVYPEGIQGIGKGFNKKYQLQRFATSFVRMSIKYRADVIPFATVNGEYINPYVLSWPWLNRLSQKIGIPYIPVGFHTLLLIFLPWLFYYGLPARLTYIRGKRIQPYNMVDKPYEQLTDYDIMKVRDLIKSQVQLDLNRAVEQYGSPRYSTKKIQGRKFRDLATLAYYTPPGWPLLFHEHHRLYVKYQGQNFNMKVKFWSGIKFLLKNPITWLFYLPVIGWIPMLILGYWKHDMK